MRKVETVTRYEYIMNMNGDLITLVRIGLVSISLLDWKVIYETYLKVKKTGTRSFIQDVAIEYDITRQKVHRIIKYMESKIQYEKNQ